MNFYRQSIIVFGFVVPCLIAGIVVGTVALFRSKVRNAYTEKSAHYKTYQANRKQAHGIETNISEKRSHINNWNETLRDETASVVSSHLRQISKELPPKEFQNTAFSRPTNATGFGGVSSQESVPLVLSFRASFRSMQRAFLELESRMPQLQMNELRIDRTPQASNLNFLVTYTAWED